MANFKLDKQVVLEACEAFLSDPKNRQTNPDGGWLYCDIIEISRLYDILKSKVWASITSVELDSVEIEMLSQYLSVD